MRLRSVVAALGATLTACRDKPADQPLVGTPASAVAAKISPGALRQMPWLLGTFRGGGADGTVQEPFYERYSLADDSTLVVESFKDSTLTGAIDTTRYEQRRDSLTNPGTSRYVAIAISADSVTFGPLAGVKNGFTWRKGDDRAWTAVIIPPGNSAAKQRTYRMARIR